MQFRLIYDIAKGLLLARWRQTLVAAIGVTFSITMFITLLSFMTGLNEMLDGLILNRTPHVRLYNEIKPNEQQPVNQLKEYRDHYNFIHSLKAAGSRQEIYNSAPVIASLSRDSRVLGVAPKITSQVFFNEGNIDISGMIYGIDVPSESRLFNFTDYIVAGSGEDLARVPNSIVLGKALAEKLLAETGDMIQLTTSQGERFSLKVVGFFQSGIQDYDKTLSYASIQTVQKLLGKTSSYITDIQVKLYNINEAPAIAREYAKIYDTEAEDIQTANAQFETGTFIRTLISYSVGITLLIVAGFGIYNILHMMIYEKMDAIAILKATGFSGRDVKSIFLLIALSIGFFGGLAGLLLGFLLSSLIDQVPFVTSALPTIKTYPINYNPVYYMIGAGFSLITTWLAGWFPARKASRIDPVAIIRGK